MYLSHHLARHRARLSLLVTAAALAGCATKLAPPITGYTCCNLRPSYDAVSSHNVQAGPILPAGQRVHLDSMKRDYYLYGTLGTDYVTMSHDTARSKEDTLRWVRRIVVPADPRRQLAQWPQDIQNAVNTARVFPGMSREQVAMALSYPSPADTKDLQSPTWRYWVPVPREDDAPVDIHFDAEGRVRALEGKPAAVQTLEFRR